MDQTMSGSVQAPTVLMHSDGYFTCMRYLLRTAASELERRIGFSQDALSQGWDMYRPMHPISASMLLLRGTSRFPDGVMPNGDSFESLLAQRYGDSGRSMYVARMQVAAFFTRSPDLTPIKLVPLRNRAEISYPPGGPIGLPQFKLANPIVWQWLRRYESSEEIRIEHLDG